MLTKGMLLAFIAVGAATEYPCYEHPRILAAEETRPTVYVWPTEIVELVCRPSNEAGCHWASDFDANIGDKCELIVNGQIGHGHGRYRCMQGKTTLGSVQLQVPDNRYAKATISSDTYIGHVSSLGSNAQRDYYMCSDTGRILVASLVCDGYQSCDNGEDEDGCFLPCAQPATLEHSHVAPLSELYPHGASVTYTCDDGFVAHEALGELRRTCRHGQWSGRPPVCQRNAAFAAEVTADGVLMTGPGPQLAVDGKTDTWVMLAPWSRNQSLTVKLNASTAVDAVLVWTTSNQFTVYAGSDSSNVCACTKPDGRSSSPGAGPQEAAGLFRCDCSALTGTHTEVTVAAGRSGYLGPLAVAEIAVLGNTPQVDECARLDRPAHGRFQPQADLQVKLVCDAGYRPSCRDPMPCTEAATGVATCVPVSCASPPLVPNAELKFSNGTGWSAVAQYQCAPGHVLFPPEQRTAAVCEDGLWSISHVQCIPSTDIRAVTLRLGEQHARSVSELRAELSQLLGQLERVRRRLARLEEHSGLTWDQDELEELASGEMAALETELREEPAENTEEELLRLTLQG